MFRSFVLIVGFSLPCFLLASHHSHNDFDRERTQHQVKRFLLLKRHIESASWNELATQVTIGVASREITLSNLQKLAREYPETPFAHAVQASSSILSLTEKTGLHLKTIFPIALFAETALSDEIAQGTFFWAEDRYGRELQYDPQTSSLFIHLGTKGVEGIGAGRKKIVTKTILYDRSHPKVLARGVTEWDISSEFTAMKRLDHLPCLLHPVALMTHVDPSSHKKLMTIVTRLYRPGSLQQVISDRSYNLTLKERLTIACDIITGLAAMHKKLYVHRDLGARNYFVDINGSKPNRRQIKAVVADMGRALPLIRAHKVPVQGNACYLSPEGFFRTKMSAFDYFPSDVFAMGCVMWQLYYDELPAWGKKRFFRQETLPLKKRHKKHLSLLKRTRDVPLEYLRNKQKKLIPLTLKDRFLALILQMTDPDPVARGKAVDLRTQFEALLKEAG